MVRARKIKNTGTRKVIGKFPSLKMNTVVWWESQIERDYIYLLEIDPEVVSYQEQPLTITYTMEGKVRKYTPDFLVNQLQKKLLVEVKPDEKAHSKKNLNLFRHIAPIAKTHNMEFVVVTEKMIRVQPKLNNVKLLYKYARVSLSLSNYLNVREYFHANQSASFELTMSPMALLNQKL